MWIILFFLFSFIAPAESASNSESAPQIVRYPAGESPQDARQEYIYDVLKLALHLTEKEFGPYVLKAEGFEMVQERLIAELAAQRTIDVVPLPALEKGYTGLQPIQIPIRQGLLGWRLLLIRCDEQVHFNDFVNLQDLNHKQAGYSLNWGDLPVSEFNFEQLASISGYEALFQMLSTGRFDFIHRGLHEVIAEAATFTSQYPNLCVEKNLILQYPLPEYLYLNEDDEVLAERLQTGLEKAVSSGRLRALALNAYQDIFNHFDIHNRRLIQLHNPMPIDKSKVDNKDYWIHPSLLLNHH
ncbi:hypothetical protein CWE09_04830 [Aliidiomarina minuta]|uniref:Solute-binding protein family 3/N-terminal domain-containing protein n=1 Tax=Aliidiomarina minuta TaxID=880057 RepID=A0A432W7M4_9GAMM|nr:ABC transporter substrate-binding protein [Aliidiomarina minuta]RUO26055.1 hypothetical protein CWE09_04830 [Aliidiomarina minuta]